MLGIYEVLACYFIHTPLIDTIVYLWYYIIKKKTFGRGYCPKLVKGSFCFTHLGERRKLAIFGHF